MLKKIRLRKILRQVFWTPLSPTRQFQHCLSTRSKVLEMMRLRLFGTRRLGGEDSGEYKANAQKEGNRTSSISVEERRAAILRMSRG